jgi:regulator of sirC expression with transglutaminase-like and TPR domain
MSSDSEIHALIQLLDDTDQEVFKHVYNKLKSLGPDAIPALEEVWSADLNSIIHERLEEIIHEIQYEALTEDWELWLEQESPDLLSGAFLIAKYHYPDIHFEDLSKKVTKLKQNIWLELNYSQTPLEQIQIFNQVFYSYHGFKGSQTTSDFQDFCINQVVDSKKGSAISIGILYQVLANELNLPVYGITLTRHFILAFCKRTLLDFSEEENNEREIMFYVNPINKGSIFSRNEIKDYLEKMNVTQEPKYFLPADNLSIIKELLGYLIDLYSQQNRENRVDELQALLNMMNG